jgi:hypothetical protein
LDDTGTINGIPFHNYEISIPPIVIGIPYTGNNTAWFGKIFYTSGYNYNVTLRHQIPNSFQILGARVINASVVSQMQAISGQLQFVKDNLDTLWDSLPEDMPYTISDAGNGNNQLLFDMTTKFDQFPIPQPEGPAQCDYYIAIKQTIAQLPFGQALVTNSMAESYKDWKKKDKSTNLGNISVDVRGAWLRVGYSGTVVDPLNLADALPEQYIRSDVNSTTIRTYIQYVNTGSDLAYNVNLTINLTPNVFLLQTVRWILYTTKLFSLGYLLMCFITIPLLIVLCYSYSPINKLLLE